MWEAPQPAFCRAVLPMLRTALLIAAASVSFHVRHAARRPHRCMPKLGLRAVCVMARAAFLYASENRLKTV